MTTRSSGRSSSRIGRRSRPELTENGEAVTNLVATNLGRGKSIVLAVDRSQSMDGQPLADAVEAARAFVAAKPPEDRISVLTFATEPVPLTGFQTSTTDADAALRSISTNPVRGRRCTTRSSSPPTHSPPKRISDA